MARDSRDIDNMKCGIELQVRNAMSHLANSQVVRRLVTGLRKHTDPSTPHLGANSGVTDKRAQPSLIRPREADYR